MDVAVYGAPDLSGPHPGKFRRKHLDAAGRLHSVAGLTSSEAEGAIEASYARITFSTTRTFRCS